MTTLSICNDLVLETWSMCLWKKKEWRTNRHDPRLKDWLLMPFIECQKHDQCMHCQKLNWCDRSLKISLRGLSRLYMRSLSFLHFWSKTVNFNSNIVDTFSMHTQIRIWIQILSCSNNNACLKSWKFIQTLYFLPSQRYHPFCFSEQSAKGIN